MTIYQEDTSVIFRLDTGIDDALLANATEISILVQKPSGTNVTWTATQYIDPDDGATSEIIYITGSGDLDEAGNYILQSYIEWGTNTHHGDSTIVTVYEPLTSRVNVSQLIRYFGTYYRFIDVQTFTEYNTDPEDGTDSDILYEDFELYSEQASDELANLCASKGITLTNNQTYVALCHLVADYFEMGNPDFSFRSQSQAPGVSFSRGDKTGPRQALEKMLKSISDSARIGSVTCGRGASTEIIRIKDAKNYPNRWKRTGIPAYDSTSDGFDSEEVSDMGYDYNDYE